FLEDFGGGTDVPDNTDAFKKAFAVSKAVRLKNGTYHVVEGGIELPAQYLLVGEGRSTELACGSNSAFTVTGALGALKRAGIMRDLSISTDPRSNVLVYTHAEQARFYNVFFYHIAYIMDDAHYFYFYDCESHECYFEVKPDSNTTNYLNESIVFLRSYFSACNILAKNTAELTLINCIMFSSPDYAVRTETVFLNQTENDEAIGFPVIVIGTTFDAIQGKCLELKDAPYSVISGNFFSSWTDAAVKLDSSRCVKLAENNISANGPGVDVADCKYLDISNNMFNECRTIDFGAINLTGSSYININGNTFAHAKVYGTDHSNKITKGITNNDATADHVLISSNVFGESVTEPTNISTSAGTGNRIVGNVGLYDSAGNRGETSSRPSNPNYGDMYYDTTLGLPIWWNSVTSSWQRADGTN
ncbi:right-handed parallel beta-helix repeat-containing protein, partial [Escherichia coli]|uniref:right-handed parallel beta-helix repeat-containing protein n=1 Tax=Escherichia coli TaxID=562 RepID=UPI001C55C97C